MNKGIFFMIGVFVILSMNSFGFALPAPQYLSVPHWKNCVKTMTKGTAQFVCLPTKKPRKCPSVSWKSLTMGTMINTCKADD